MDGSTHVQLRTVLECKPDDMGAIRRRDEISSRMRRTFLPRHVCEKLPEYTVQQEVP